MTDDLLKTLMQRNRPKVENRDASLSSASPDTSMSGNHDTETSTMLQTQVTESPDSQISGKANNPTPENPDASPKAQVAKIKPELPELATKQSTLRLEAQISEDIQILCREQNICREVLIEALYQCCKDNQKLMDKVLAEAKKRNDYRLQMANRRRAKSMMDKFG